MKAKPPTKRELAEQFVAKFPKTPSLTLARMLYKEHRRLFKDVEAARCAVRYVRGARGKRMRKHSTPELQRLSKAGDIFDQIPDGLSHMENTKPYIIPNGVKIGLISDVHIPYHDKSALKRALHYIRDYNPDVLVMNGDLADFFAVSFWEKDPRVRDFSGEIKACREFIQVIRKAFPKTKIIYKIGNHEYRYERYLMIKAPELLGVDDFLFERLLRLREHDIDLVSDKRLMKAGKLNIAHGHEWKFAISNPVNPARGFYLRAKDQILAGHLHQASSHSEKTVNDVIISSWSVGCLCNLKADYAPYNNWSHSFATIETDKTGNFEVNVKKIIHDRIYAA